MPMTRSSLSPSWNTSTYLYDPAHSTVGECDAVFDLAGLPGIQAIVDGVHQLDAVIGVHGGEKVGEMAPRAFRRMVHEADKALAPVQFLVQTVPLPAANGVRAAEQGFLGGLQTLTAQVVVEQFQKLGAVRGLGQETVNPAFVDGVDDPVQIGLAGEDDADDGRMPLADQG